MGGWCQMAAPMIPLFALNPWTTWIVYIESLTWEFYPERDELPSTCIICSATMLPVFGSRPSTTPELSQKGKGAQHIEPLPQAAGVGSTSAPFAYLLETSSLCPVWRQLGRKSPERLFAIQSPLGASWGSLAQIGSSSEKLFASPCLSYLERW